MNKYCQGPKCHTYMTTDRKRGMKGSKYYQTRTISTYSYGDQSFCTLTCQNDWWTKHGTAAVDHFGRLREPIKLTEENAWYKYRDWRRDSGDRYYFANPLSQQEIPITEEQYQDENLARP